jgi:hypothetical protein
VKERARRAFRALRGEKNRMKKRIEMKKRRQEKEKYKKNRMEKRRKKKGKNIRAS